MEHLNQIRQGDVLLVTVDQSCPEGLIPSVEVILAKGEATGHQHILTGPEVYEWEVAGQRYVKVEGGVGYISHPEHDPVPAPVIVANITYKVVPQQEWDLRGQWRKVVD